MKIVATIALLALATSYVAAECNNMCSGHGTCGANDACTCYRNWRGNDCSERTCQFGVGFVDTAQGDLNHDGQINDKAVTGSYALTKTQWAPASTGGTFEQRLAFANEEAHAYYECSNKGMCDRTSGECACYDGYEGSACQRTVCHNSCSGHGICRNIIDKTQDLSATAKHAYQLWDGLKNQACVCDPGYSGIDCRERLCPKGADPLDDGKVNEVQTVDIGDSGTIGGTFTLSYTDLFGEVWTTTAIPASDSDQSSLVKAALVGIPNSVIEDVTVSSADTGQGGEGRLYTISFTHNAGNLNLLTADVTAVTGSGASAVVATTTAGTTVAQECSGRGLCDYETGVCQCFRGYRLDDCSNQHALAFSSV